MKTLRQVIGFALMMAGIWLPFYIGSCLPDGWSSCNTSFWWSFPTMLHLAFGGVGAFVIGGVIIAFTLIKTETN